jgi:serine phosphatase RsbU (regulator of sigma subunit)
VTTGVRSLAAAPLLDPDGPLGMIVVGSRLHVRQFEEEDMELLTSLASVAAMRIRNVRLAEEAAERRRLQREVALARRIQEALLPETLPEVPGWELWGVTVPSRGVSGDMFKVVRREDGCIVLLLADVSGKGMGASLLTASLEALTAVPIQDGYPPGKVFRWAGRLLHDRTPPEKYATAFLGVLDPEEGELVWCNAGHPPGLILEPRGSCRRLGTTGIPLGLFADADYGEQTGTVERGETLVLYSDGVTEAARDGEELGVDGLERICSANLDLTAQELGSAISGELERFAGEGAFADDRTLIVARRLC